MLLRCESLEPPMSQLGQTRTSSLGAARPLPPSADIGPGGQSVGQAAHDGRPQLGRAGDVVVPRVEGHSGLKPLVTHWVSSRIVPRTDAVHRMPKAGCKARTRTDEGAILP